ncbi:MAG TPA: cysteine desulfurase [Clostridiales bacterium]|nr:cysteine desulfurase [Clostridiales bacterium]
MNHIYLDNAATTAVCPEAVAAAIDAMTQNFGNPSSLHKLGFSAERLLEKARATVAQALSARADEVYFTPGGTYSMNMALLGAARARKSRGKHIISTEIEHDAAQNALNQLEDEGFTVTRLVPDATGRISASAVAEALTDETVLVSVMLANNVTGRLQPVSEMAAAIKRAGSKALLHTDAAQAFLKVPISVAALGVDLLSVSSHKIHGPKGAGALYVRKGVCLSPILFGGGQEKGLAPGTEGMPAIAGFAAAVAAMGPLYRQKAREIEEVKRYGIAVLQEKCPKLRVLSDGDVPGVFAVSLPGYQSETLVHFLAEEGIYVSGGAACGKGKPSRALLAMGLPRDTVISALRISLSAETTKEHMQILAEALAKAQRLLAHR